MMPAAAARDVDPAGQGAALVAAERAIAIGRDAQGNIILTGDANVVVVQQLQAVPEPEPAPPEPGELGPNPYKGLEAFQEEDADRFFGREALIAQLWGRFRELHVLPPPGQARHRLLPILGPSGSGKSSLARAGLIPELARHPLPALRSPRVAVLTPGSDPCHALGTVLARVATGDPMPAAKAREFAEEVRRPTAAGGFDGLRRIADLLPGIERSPLVVLVDQFEETYALCQDGAGRDAFVGALLDAAADPAGRVSVVLTLRSDFLGATIRHPALNQLVAKEGVLVPAMDEAGLRRAIAEPARLAGHPLDEGTVELLVRETVGREGALPLLQFALTRIWEGLGQGRAAAETLRELSGVGGALASEADRLLAELARQGLERVARRAFLAMVHLGEGARDTRRRARLAEIMAAGETPEAVLEVLRRFAKPGERLVSLAGEGGEVTAEVTHEQLIERWPKLKAWLDEGRDDLRFHRRLADAAAEWKAGRGGLWRPPELDLLKAYRARAGADLTAEEVAFADASTRDWQDQLDREQARLDHDRRMQDRLRRFARVVTVLAAVLALAAALSAYFWYEANRQRIAAQATTGRLLGAEAQRRLAQPITQETSPLIAALATAGWRLQKTSDAWNAMQRVPLVTTLARITHDGAVWAVAFSPDGKLLATAGGTTARLVAVADGRELARIAHSGSVGAVAFSPDGQLLAIESGESGGEGEERLVRSEVRLVAVAGGHEIARLAYDGVVNAVVFSPDGQLLATAGEDGTARLVSTEDGRELARIAHDGEARAVAFSPDGKYLATASKDGTARLVAVADGRELARIAHDGWVNAVAFSPDGKLLATAASGLSTGKVRLVAVAGGHEIAPIVHDDDAVWAVTFSPDGKLLAIAGGTTARLVAVAGGRELARIAHDGEARAVAFSPDGKYLATASDDKTARLVAVADGRELARIAHDGWAKTVAFSPDGKYLATASDDKTARLVAVAGGREIARIAHSGFIGAVAVAFSPDGQLLATASGDSDRGEARLVAVTDGREIARIAHKDWVWAAAFSPDGQLLATASGNVGKGEARLVAVVDHRELVRIAYDDEVNAVAFSPDGKYLATASGDIVGIGNRGEARLVAVADGREIARIPHDYRVDEVAFSPDGKLLATAGGDTGGGNGEARLVSTEDGREIARIAHDGEARAVAFSPDGKYLATAGGSIGSGNGEARLMVVADGREIARIAHGGVVNAVAFSPDGKLLATASVDGMVRLWSTDFEDMPHQLCAGPGRNLSHAEWRWYLGDLPWQPTCANWPTPSD